MKIYLLLAEGFETIEALTPIDIFRRAGTDIESVSITGSLSVTSSQGIEVKADALWEDINFDDGDALILPGGYPGYENLNRRERLRDDGTYSGSHLRSAHHLRSQRHRTGPSHDVPHQYVGRDDGVRHDRT